MSEPIPCIGQLEHHLHSVFSQERVPGESFVYISSLELFNTLDDFCDDQSMSEKRPPLLLLGPPGSGKSALLANWLQRRQRNLTRGRQVDDFVFYHAVGCTRQSKEVNSLLRRLMTDLKHRFELSRDVSSSQSRLSWDLPRFLELASKKGKAIIVIDGLHRLESNEGETGLSWLPLEFPPNIRVVLSATSASSSDSSTRKSHVVAELERRKWQMVNLKPLDSPKTFQVIESFIKKTVEDESSSFAGGAFITNPEEIEKEEAEGNIPGFLLFDTHIKSIQAHSLSKNPLFLRVLLRCAQWSVARGFSLWYVLNEWLKVDTMEGLYGTILDSFERGFTKTEEEVESSRHFCKASGALDSLKVLYPWHPSFQKSDEQSNAELLAVEFQYNLDDPVNGGSNSNALHNRGNTVVNNGMNMQSTGGQQWMLVNQLAEQKLDAARVDTQRGMDALMKQALKRSQEEGVKFVDAFVQIQQEVIESQFDGSEFEEEDNDSQRDNWSSEKAIENKGASSDTVDIDSLLESPENKRKSRSVDWSRLEDGLEEDEDGFEQGSEDGSGALGHSRKETSPPKRLTMESMTIPEGHEEDDDKNAEEEGDFQSNDTKDGDEDPFEQQGAELSALEENINTDINEPPGPIFEGNMESGDDGSSTVSSATLSNSERFKRQLAGEGGLSHHRHTEAAARASKQEKYSHKQCSMPVFPSSESVEDSDSLSTVGKSKAKRRISKERSLPSLERRSRSAIFDSSEDETEVGSIERLPVEFDEALQIDVLPMYLTGGVSTAGFNRILGNALALLYVARHGLKENELWSILCTLPVSDKKASSGEANSTALRGGPVTEEVKALLQVCHYYCEEFLGVWKSNDVLHTGRLSPSKLLVGMKTVNPEFTGKDLEMLLSALQIKASCAFSSVSSMSNHKTVDYYDLCEKISKGHRATKMADVKKKSKPDESAEIESVNDLEDPLFQAVQVGEELDGFAVMSADDINSTNSLGPVLEEGLLSALCALGVSHSPKDQVILLPCDNEQLRNVILERYILSNNGSPEEWHMRLIQFFSRKKISLRRCEELPWHLKICRRWYSLRNVLSDLKTFKTMAEGHLRDELLNYWALLTRSPLYTSDQAEAEASNANRVQLSENMRILSEIDSAAALHLNAKDIRKQLLKDCVANFDIVEDLEKTVEAWITKSMPSGTKLAKMIMFIAKFLAEFCRLFETSTPPFLRLGMEQKFFDMFNITLEGQNAGEEKTESGEGELDNKNLSSSSSQLLDKNQPEDELKKVLSKATPVGNNVTNMSKENAHLYLYYRWIWIHFPWLAMPSSSEHLSSLMTKNGKSVNVIAEASTSSKPTPKKKDSKKMLSATQPSLTSSSLLAVGEAGMNQNLTRQNSASRQTHRSGRASQSLEPLAIPEQSTAGRGFANRSWNVHKLDPSKSPVIKPSRNRNAALTKTSMSSTLSLDAIESFSKHIVHAKHTYVVRDDNDDENSGTHNPRDKFRCSMEEHMSHMSTIPFSKSSNRSIRRGTLFPSVEDNFNASHNAKMDSMDDFSRQVSSKFGGLSAEDEEKHSFDDEMEHIKRMEKLKALNSRDNSAIPSADPESVIRTLDNEKSGKLRKAFDQVVEIRRKKEHQLREMRSSYVIRDDVDEEVKATLRLADETMNRLEDRYVSLQSALTEAKVLNQAYSKLISFLKVNQPSTETHMTSLEQEVHLANQQCKDMKAYRSSIYDDIEKIEKVMLKNLKAKLQTIKAQRSLVQKKQKIQKSMLQDLESELKVRESDWRYKQHIHKTPPQTRHKKSVSSPNSYYVERSGGELFAEATTRTIDRPSMISLIGALNKEVLPGETPPDSCLSEAEASETSSTKIEREVDELPGLSEQHEVETHAQPMSAGLGHKRSRSRGSDSDVLTSKGEEMKKKLLHLYQITSTNSEDDFINVFKNSQRLYESMKSHQVLAESRLSQLRSEFNELQGMLGETIYVQHELEASESSSSSSSEREMRYMDQRMFQAEMRLNRNMRRTEKSVLNINEVRTGVLHIAQLLSVNDKLLQNLPSSNPPIIKSESGVAKMLAWCEERVLAINEALVLDASKPNQIDDSKPLWDRQTDLAQLIQALLRRGNPSSSLYKHRLKIVKSGSISKDILRQLDGNEATELEEGSTAIRVKSDMQAEVLYKHDVDEAISVLEARAIVEETAASNAKYEDRTEAMLKLLNKAIASQESETALRRANKLANRKQGRRAGFGWTIEELLRSDANSEPSEAKTRLTKQMVEQNSFEAMDRLDVKKESRQLLRALHDKKAAAEDEGKSTADAKSTAKEDED